MFDKELRKEDAVEFVRNEFLRLYPFTHINEDAAEYLSEYEGRLCLDGVSEISDESITHLSSHRGFLGLGLITISEYGARLLATHKGEVELDHLEKIPDTPGHVALVKHMCSQSKEVRLNGLKDIPDAIADVLSSHNGTVQLDGLTTLTHSGLAQKLASQTGDLILNVTSITDDIAAILASKKRGSIQLPMLKSIFPIHGKGFVRLLGLIARKSTCIELNHLEFLPDESARKLAGAKGMISLNGLKFFPDSPGHQVLAHKLASQPKAVKLAMLSHIPERIAAIFATNALGVILDGLTEITEIEASILAKSSGELTLGLCKITPDVARTLSKHAGPLRLEKLNDIDLESLQLLVQHNGYTSLGLRSVCTTVVAELVKHRGGLGLNQLSEITQECAHALAGSAATALSMSGIRYLKGEGHAALTRKMAEQSAPLDLTSLVELGDSCANALSQYRGEALSMPAISAISDSGGHKALARCLALQRKSLVFNQLTELGSGAAAELALSAAYSMTFMNPEFKLTTSVAEALADFNGTLSFANKSISASVAKALSQHEGDLALNRIEYIDVECAKFLSNHGDYLLELDGLTDISEEARSHLENHEGPYSICGFDQDGEPT